MWHARQQPLRLRTTVGEIKLQVWYGLDPAAQSWGCPMRQRWGLAPAQRTSPGFEDKVLFTATATGTYEQAAAVASKWGSPIDDSTVHELVQRVGARAEAQNAGAAQNRAAGDRPGACAQCPGGGDGGRLAGALSRAGLGAGENR